MVVVLQRIDTDSNEHRMTCLLSSEEHRNPRNPLIKVLAILQDELDARKSFVVAPLYHYYHGDAENLGDVIEYVDQVLDVCLF